MGTTYPPDGLSDDQATWGTDIDRDTAIFKTGNSSIVFNDTTPGANPRMVDDEYYPCAAGDLFRVSGWVRADTNGGGEVLRIHLSWYTGAKIYDSQSASFNDDVDAVDTWEYKSAVVTAPVNAAYFRLYFSKTKTAYFAWFDSVEVVRAPPAFWVYIDNDTAYATAATIIFDIDDGTGETYNFGDHYNPATGQYTAPASGMYSFVAMAIVDNADLDAGEVFYIYFDKNGPGGTIVGYGTRALAQNANEGGRSLAVSGPLWLAAGETIEIKLTETHAGNVTVLGSVGVTPFSYFGGSRVQ